MVIEYPYRNYPMGGSDPEPLARDQRDSIHCPKCQSKHIFTDGNGKYHRCLRCYAEWNGGKK